jgi:plasmid stability protein
MIKTTLYLPDELHTSLKVEAATDKISMTELIIKLLTYRETLAKLPEKMKSKAVKALSEFDTEEEKNKYESGLSKKRGEVNSDDYV